MKINVIVTMLIFLLVIGGLIYYFENNKKFNESKENIQSTELNQEFVNLINEKYSLYNQEFVFCLFGEIQGDKAIITHFSLPENFESSNHDISFSGCYNPIFNSIKKTKFLGTLHNHPLNVCVLGEQDVYTFGRSNDAIMGLICGEDKIHIFTRNNLINGIELSIT